MEFRAGADPPRFLPRIHCFHSFPPKCKFSKLVVELVVKLGAPSSAMYATSPGARRPMYASSPGAVWYFAMYAEGGGKGFHPIPYAPPCPSSQTLLPIPPP